MKIRVVLEYGPEANAFSAVCPELPGCASAGDTEEDARKNIKEALTSIYSDSLNDRAYRSAR